ncbi:hypothetical protein [Streptomyces sp. NPDC050485]|uniref:hypothetical protein n=1 Tax=Streptomyces sp. NPDC050485 TaxID=3365617 RepID=UPI003787B379
MIINEQATALHWDKAYKQGRKFLPVTPEEVEYFQLHVKTVPGMVAVDVGCGVRHEVARGEWIRLRRPVEAGIAIPG